MNQESSLFTKFYNQMTKKIVNVVRTKLSDDSVFTTNTRILLLPFASLNDMTKIADFVGPSILANHPKLMTALANGEDLGKACWDVLESCYEGQYTFGQGNDNGEYDEFLNDVEKYVFSGENSTVA